MAWCSAVFVAAMEFTIWTETRYGSFSDSYVLSTATPLQQVVTPFQSNMQEVEELRTLLEQSGESDITELKSMCSKTSKACGAHLEFESCLSCGKVRKHHDPADSTTSQKKAKVQEPMGSN